MMQQFAIPGRLPGMNEIIGANRSNRFAGASQKREAQERIGAAIKAAGLRPMRTPVSVYIVWHEEPRRRDPDNIFSGAKFILDALQAEGIIENDSWSHVAHIGHDRFAAQKGDGYVLVTLEEV